MLLTQTVRVARVQSRAFHSTKVTRVFHTPRDGAVLCISRQRHQVDTR